MIRALFILVLLCAPVAAQQTVPITEELPNDQFIVTRNGKEYRALPPSKIAELAKQRIDLEAAQKINAELLIQIRELTLQRDLAHAQEALEKQKADSLRSDFERARGDSARWQGLFTEERQLRKEPSQFIPHSSVKGFWGKVLNVLDDPRSQAFFKIGAPLYQMIRCQ